MGIYRNDDSLVDGNVIHTDIQDEINQIPEKTTPVGSDVIVIESEADSFHKRKVAISNLPDGGAKKIGAYTMSGDLSVDGAIFINWGGVSNNHPDITVSGGTDFVINAAGAYEFHLALGGTGSSHTIQVELYNNGGNVTPARRSLAFSQTQYSGGGISFALNLSQNDVVSVRVSPHSGLGRVITSTQTMLTIIS